MKSLRTERVMRMIPAAPAQGRSLFFGDPVEITSQTAAGAIGQEDAPEDAAVNAIVAQNANDAIAAEKVAAYRQMTPAERAQVTMLPVLASWNAFVTINPLVSPISAQAVNYNLQKMFNEYPYAGKTISGVPLYDSGSPAVHIGHRVTIDYATIMPGSTVEEGDAFLIAVPFLRFTISASTLSARPGAQITIDLDAYDEHGVHVSTKEEKHTYAFQRESATSAIVGAYIPPREVVTRTCPVLPIAGKIVQGESYVERKIIIDFIGTDASEQVTVTIPGFAAKETYEIARMYSLPAGMFE